MNKVHLRYRIDGILREFKVPEDMYYIEPAIVSRIKIMSNLDVVEHRIPQDGRAKVRLQKGEEVDLRISIIPGYFGENVVIRILPSQVLLDLDVIGFNPDEVSDASWEDINSYEDGIPITATTTYAIGALLQNKVTGGVYWVSRQRGAWYLCGV